MSNPTPPKVKKFPPAKQRRLDQLLEKYAQGTISVKDKPKLETLVAEAEVLMVENSQRLAKFARSQSPQPPSSAVPVTI